MIGFPRMFCQFDANKGPQEVSKDMLERSWSRHKSRDLWDSELHAENICGANARRLQFVVCLFVSFEPIIILGNPKIAQPLSLKNVFVVGMRTSGLHY